MSGTEFLFRRDFQLERSIRDSLKLPKFDRELFHMLYSSRATQKEALAWHGFAWERPTLKQWLMDTAGVKPDSGSFDDLSPEILAQREITAAQEALEVAIDALGTEMVRWMSITYTMRQLFEAGNETAESLWADAHATGEAARLLAMRLGRDDGEILGLAGLLHDIGKILLLQNHPQAYATHYKAFDGVGASSLRQEVVHFHYTHTVLGTVVCRHWKLPVQVNIATRFHHGWTLEVPIREEYLEVVSLVAWASQIAHERQGHQTDIPAVIGESLDRMGLPLEKRQAMGVELAAEMTGIAPVPV